MSKTAELQALLDSQPKLESSALPSFLVEEADFDVGRVVLRFAPQPAFQNYHGNVQGGFAVALVDVLISVAAFTRARAWLPTVEIKSTFLAPLLLGESRGEASVIKAGKQLVFLEAKLWGPNGKLAVHATATACVPLSENHAYPGSAAA